MSKSDLKILECISYQKSGYYYAGKKWGKLEFEPGKYERLIRELIDLLIEEKNGRLSKE